PEPRRPDAPLHRQRPQHCVAPIAEVRPGWREGSFAIRRAVRVEDPPAWLAEAVDDRAGLEQHGHAGLGTALRKGFPGRPGVLQRLTVSFDQVAALPFGFV